MKRSPKMTSLTVLFIISVVMATVAAFTQKSECLLHISRDEEAETEGEGYEVEGGVRGGETEGGGGGGGREGFAGRRRHDSEEETEDGVNRLPGQVDHEGQGRMTGRRYLDEEGEWEDARRRRKRGDGEQEMGSVASQDTLFGVLSCGPDSVMHVLNVSVGYSSTGRCNQASVGCQAGSSLAKQAIHCQGNKGTCAITIGRHFLIRCGHQANFALVFYECIPATKRANICSGTNTDISDGLVLTSPNYPEGTSRQPLPAASSDIVACECTIRAPANTHLEIEYVRTHLPITGTTCDGDMLVLERPDPLNDGRFLMEREICGQNVSNNVVLTDHIMRVTFLTGSQLSEGKKGFLAKFRALSPEGLHEIFHVTCLDGHPGPSQDSLAKLTVGQSNLASGRSTPPPSNPSAYASRLLEWAKRRGRTISPNFDPNNLPPDFLNLTREQLQAKLEETRAKAQKIVGIQNEGSESLGASGGSIEDSSASGGVLSGVVASLSAVVLILGSIGAFIFYRRHQRQKQKDAHTPQEAQPSDNDYWHNGNMRKKTLESRTKERDSVPSVKNQNRPLPNPNTENSEPNRSSRLAESCKLASQSWTQEASTSRAAKTGQIVVGSRGQISDGGPNIYSVATSIPNSDEVTEGFAKLSNKPRFSKPNPEIRPHTQAPPHYSEDSCQSSNQPIAPQRTKRQKVKNLNKTPEIEYTSPYDNATGNIQSGNRESVSAENSDDQSRSSTQDNFPAIGGDESDNYSGSIYIRRDEEEDYSCINDIQIKVESSYAEDNTEV